MGWASRRVNEADFDAFVEARYRDLLTFATWLDGRQGSADLLHEALARALAVWRRAGAPDNPEAYIRTIMINLTSKKRSLRPLIDIDSVEQRRLPVEVPPSEVEPDVAAQLQRVVSELPPRQRMVIVLRFGAGLSDSQTADAMKCSIGTVKSQQSKALAKIRADPSLARAISENEQ